MMARYFFILWFIINSGLLFDVSCGLVSSWGEPCNFTDECADHRMVCSSVIDNISKCTCDRFHEWKGVARGCMQKYDTETILNMTIKSTDNKGVLEKDQEFRFFWHKFAGFFVMSVALCCPIAVAIHCFHMKRKDRILKGELSEIRFRVDKAKHKMTMP